MTKPHKLGAFVTALFILVASNSAAFGDTTTPAPTVPVPNLAPAYMHLADPSVLTTHAGTILQLPPGYWMDEPTHKVEDDKRKAEQDLDTRLTAENKSLRAAAASWQPGWKTLASAIISGVALGWYLHGKI